MACFPNVIEKYCGVSQSKLVTPVTDSDDVSTPAVQ